jgi:YaiO family outer membrane protein
VRSNKTSATVLVNIRTYFGDSDNFLGIRGGFGSSPDEDKLRYSTDVVLFYPTSQLSVELQRRAFGRWVMKCEFTYARENPGRGYYQRYATQLTLKTVF